MSSANKILEQMRSLLVQANAATNNGDINLTGAVQTLIAGYGQGSGNLDSLIDGSITAIESSDVKAIRDDAFRGTALVSGIFPNVTTLGLYSFYGCTALKNVYLPKVTEVKTAAFGFCSSLETITLQSATRIRNSAFTMMGPIMEGFFFTALRIVDLPVCTAILDDAFGCCGVLEAVILRNETTVCDIHENAFQVSSVVSGGTGYLYVPRTLLASYQETYADATFASQFRAIEDYPAITGG